MKSLLSFSFSGELVDNPQDSYRLAITINGRRTVVEKITRKIALWDTTPEAYACRCRVELLHNANKSSGIFGKKEEFQMVEDTTYTFMRGLNMHQSIDVDRELGEQLKHTDVEYANKGFIFPECDSVLGRSTLQVINSLNHNMPVSMSFYFRDFNRMQVLHAKNNKENFVVLLKQHSVTSMNRDYLDREGNPIEQRDTIFLYYYTYLKRTDEFPFIPYRELNKNEEVDETVNQEEMTEVDDEKNETTNVLREDDDARVVDLMSFDKY